jgi:hypothetical protein
MIEAHVALGRPRGDCPVIFAAQSLRDGREYEERCSTLAFVLLSAFTGYLGGSPVTEGSYLRFRLLHTVVVPFLGTLSLLAWRILVGRYQVLVPNTDDDRRGTREGVEVDPSNGGIS